MLEIEIPGPDTGKLDIATINTLEKAARIMEEFVVSGRLAEKYGPRYSHDSLTQLSKQFDREIRELIPGGTGSTERLEAISTNYLEIEGPIINYKFQRRTPVDTSSRILIENSTYKPTLKGYLHSVLYIARSLRIPFNVREAEIDFDTTMVPNITESKFRADLNSLDNPKITKARISLSSSVLPVTQEEYFHAAHALTFGTVSGIELADERIKEVSLHVQHESLLLDRILSAAAAELGTEEFTYWAEKADDVTARFKERFIRNSAAPWDKTPLGREVNKRFRYPVYNYSELGALLIDRTDKLESIAFRKNGRPDTDTQALIEIISFQFGSLHREISSQMLDGVETKFNSESDFEKIGRNAVEWGKQILARYKATPEEEQLVTHHTHIQNDIDESKLEFEISKRIAKSINSNGSFIRTTLLNIRSLVEYSRDYISEKIRELTAICFPSGTESFIRPPDEIIKKHGFEPHIFDILVKRAKNSFDTDKRQEGEEDNPFNLIEDKVLTFKGFK